jgi:hypothetical protein
MPNNAYRMVPNSVLELDRVTRRQKGHRIRQIGRTMIGKFKPMVVAWTLKQCRWVKHHSTGDETYLQTGPIYGNLQIPIRGVFW